MMIARELFPSAAPELPLRQVQGHAQEDTHETLYGWWVNETVVDLCKMNDEVTKLVNAVSEKYDVIARLRTLRNHRDEDLWFNEVEIASTLSNVHAIVNILKDWVCHDEEVDVICLIPSGVIRQYERILIDILDVIFRLNKTLSETDRALFSTP